MSLVEVLHGSIDPWRVWELPYDYATDLLAEAIRRSRSRQAPASVPDLPTPTSPTVLMSDGTPYPPGFAALLGGGIQRVTIGG